MMKSIQISKQLFGKLTLIILILVSARGVLAQVRLPRLIRDSMVLQRDQPVPIWGWARPGEKISVEFNGRKYRARTDDSGRWRVSLAPAPAGGPYQMDIRGRNRITLHNILLGDVWLCSGQSNMVLPMERVKEKYPEEIRAAHYPEIRQFFIPTLTDLQQPGDDLPKGSWKPADGKELLSFSATAYFFAKFIYEKYHVPVGLINSSVGGTPIEAWISEKGLSSFPRLVSVIQRNKDSNYVNKTNRIAEGYRDSVVNSRQKDRGLSGAAPWYDTSFIPKHWRPIYIPGYWEDQGIRDLNGIVWYRRVIELPASMAGLPAKLFMGRIVDADYVYVNGQLVGHITYQFPPRRYTVPAGLLKAGKNIFVARVINTAGKGGFVPDKPYYLEAGGQRIDLKGEWQYKVGAVYPPVPPGPRRISPQNQPTALYNAMIAPLVPFALKGILWYQGESNAGFPGAYARLLPALIADWRTKWKRDSLPFLYVQLPNFMEVNYLPEESNWALLREAQLKALSVPNTAMAVTIDIGEWNDIHPLDKKDVGYRLSLAAENKAYGENNEYSGPIYRSFQIEKNRIVVEFSHTGSGLTTCDGLPPQNFAIAGPDGIFSWANARIEGNTVVVWNNSVLNPQYVRYAWADNPENPNLCNREGLPASPFRTDDLNRQH